MLVNTKQLPEEDGLSVSIGAGMNDKTHGKRFLSAQGSSWDWLGLGSGWRSLDAGMKGGLIICGKVQYCLSIRDPRIADTSQSNGFESDNNASGAETAPFTTATFRNVTFIGPRTAKNTDFVNTSDYITAGSVFPNNGSKLGRFQSAMQIRRSSKLNVENALAVGYPVGLIVDGEKGNTVKYAREGGFSLKNIIFAGMDVIGTDKNKEYEDYLYDYATQSEDRSQLSFSHTFFLSEATNKVMEEAELKLTDPAGAGQNYCPSVALSDNKGGYIGAFRDASDNWLDGWTNFDPQNTAY